jgi:hypothetical protein
MNANAPLRLLHWEGRHLYCGSLWVGEVMEWTGGSRAGQWRAWAMTEPPGAHHGWFTSELEARRQVEAVVRAALPPLAAIGKG